MVNGAWAIKQKHILIPSHKKKMHMDSYFQKVIIDY